ncbi:MAG: hypothetical protein Q4F00_11640 [bacterium]|nr:hypothetical protein [bacterium]
MGRFGWLEFSDSKEEQKPKIPAPAAPSSNMVSLDLVANANDFFFAGLYSKALREYSRAINEDKSNRIAWTRQTLCQVALHEYTQAIVWAQKCVEVFPDDPQALSSLAFAKSWRPNYWHELPELMAQVEQKSCGYYSPQMQFDKAVCLFALQQNDAGQKTICSMLDSLESHLEQVHWMLICAAFYLEVRAAECACILLESLEKEHSLNSYGLSLWIKAEWLRNDSDKAHLLLRALRRRDPKAEDIYNIADFFKQNPVQQGGSMFNYLSQLFGKLMD